MTQISLIGAPVDSGQRRRGCVMGPAAFRVAGLPAALAALGHDVIDLGDAAPKPVASAQCPNAAVDQLSETLGWTLALAPMVQDALHAQRRPVIMGGDHALALGALAGASAYAMSMGRPLYVLWLDAHSDFHTPLTTQSGNLHGTPVAYAAGLPGFDAFPPFPAPLPADQICLFGIRSVDGPEHTALLAHGIAPVDMRVLDEHGISAPLRDFLDRVRAANGLLHVSLDVDFLDPTIAPAVGTTVPGGASFREAHLVMELLHDSGLVTSLDLVELNPILDMRGQTVELMIDLTCSLFGKKVFDRPTPSFS